MATCYRAWEALGQSTALALPFWRDLAERSFFKHEVVRHFFALALAKGFKEVTPAMLQMSRNLFAGIGQTAINECAVKSCRHREEKKAENKLLSNTSRWLAPVEDQILSGTFHYSEVPKPKA
eukprot:819129-Lingulodinium_polyedra.AAC.1